jgi:hypothetical protein
VIVDAEAPEEVALLSDVYADLKRKLTARGIPAREIRFVHEAKTRETLSILLLAVRASRVMRPGLALLPSGNIGIGYLLVPADDANAAPARTRLTLSGVKTSQCGIAPP